MEITVQNDERVMALLSEALQRPVEEREEFLRARCSADQKLYDEILEALYWEERMGSFLKEPLLELATLLRPFEPGETVAERFTIVREIGEGGMGVVYEAQDHKRNQRIAIKAAKPGFQRLLSPELEGALKVRHDNICLVNEIHTAQTQHGPIDFLSMELLQGETLSAHLKKVGKLDHKQALDIACQICAGLAQAHDSGILHRDLKCSNVLLCRKEDGTRRAVITDFGLASCKGQESTETGGTPGYMAPELWQGEKATTASDIYALGVMLYEMVTGLRPDESRQLERDTESMSTETPPPCGANAENDRPSLMSLSESDWNRLATSTSLRPPSRWTKGLDPRWNRIILRCLAAKPEDRPQHVNEVLLELKREPIPKWPFASAGVLVLLLATIFTFVRPARQWATDLIWPPNVRLAVLPFTGSADLSSVAGGALQDVAERIQQLSSGRRTVAVIPPGQLAEMKIDSPENARKVLNATHALEVHAERERDGTIDVQAEIVELKSHVKVKTLSARYSQSDLDRLQSALAGMVAMTFRLNETKSEDKLSAAATEPYLKGIYLLNRDVDSYDEALAKFQQAADRDPNSALPPAGAALALVQKFQASKQNAFLQEAKRDVQTARSRNPDSVRVLLASGQVSEAGGQYGKAVEAYKRIEDLDPRSVDAQLGLGRMYESLNEPDNALAAYRKAEELDPEYYAPYMMLGIFYEDQEQYVEAVEEFQKMVQRAPGLPDSYASLAVPLMKLNRFDESEEALQHALHIRETGQALLNLGTIRYEQKRYSEAAAYQIRALAYYPRSVTCLTNIAISLQLAEQYSKAKSYFRRAQEQAELEVIASPQSADAHANFAYTSVHIGDKRRAVQEIQQAMNLLPEDSYIRESAVVIYELLDQRDSAIAIFRGLTPATKKELVRDPELVRFIQDPRVTQIISDDGGK